MPHCWVTVDEGSRKRPCWPWLSLACLALVCGTHAAEQRRVLVIHAESRSIPVVFTPGILQDGAGEWFIPRELLPRLSEASTVPMYSVYPAAAGLGVVGCFGPSFEVAGVQAAGIALRLLDGEDPTSLNLPPVQTNAYYFDWRQLRRWGISESRLPPGSHVLFQEASPWDRYKRIIGPACAIIALQSAFIAGLVIQRRRMRRAKESLRESEAHMALAATAAKLGMWSWDIPEDRIWITPGGRELFGWSQIEELNFERLIASLHPDDRQQTRLSIQRALDREGDYEQEIRVLTGTATTRWIASRGQVEFDKNGRPTRMRGISLDVTERRQAQLEAREQRRELTHLTRVATLGELSGALAHELNQPLTAILSSAQAALRYSERAPVALPQIRELLFDIVNADRRAGEVIGRLRTMLRKGEPHLQPLRINEVVIEMLSLMRSDLLVRGVAISTYLSSELPTVLGDRIQLQQVLMNLLLNGCDAMTNTPPIERELIVKTAPGERDTVQISVIDAGSGIPAEKLEQVFEPFVTTKQHGLGLGLAICRSIITSHGGRLWAINNADHGATLHFTLPLRYPNPP